MTDVLADCIDGYVLAMFAFDIGFHVDLQHAATVTRQSLQPRLTLSCQPSLGTFEVRPRPLRLTADGEAVRVGQSTTKPSSELLLYEFGAALVTYTIPLPPSLHDIPALSAALYGHTALEADARKRVTAVMDVVDSAIERPRLASLVEDYTIFVITSWDDGVSPNDILETRRKTIANAIEATTDDLAKEQIVRSTEGVFSYAAGDLLVVDWNAAVMFDADRDDAITVMQHANVELLELRVLDEELTSILRNANNALATIAGSRFWPGTGVSRMLTRSASLQTDAAIMFEGVNNAIKLLGDQRLARLYRLVAQRLDLPSWHAAVERKLEAAESLYQKMSDTSSTKRLEALEWIIIVLIAVSIALPFLPWYH